MSETTEPGKELVPTQPGEISPDGRHRWDGHTWQLVNPPPPAALTQAQPPATQHVEMRAGAAFKLGFFAFFGAGCASLVFWVIGFIAIALLGGLGALSLGALGSHT